MTAPRPAFGRVLQWSAGTGEGDYKAAKRFDDAERAFMKSGAVEKKAREAEEALDGPEGVELERARVESGKGVTG